VSPPAGRLPSDRDGTILGLGGPLADVDRADDLALAVSAVGDRLVSPDHALGAQMRGELLAQQAASLHEQRQVDRLVTHLQLRVVGERATQPARDLLR
jgi:hypothetical protein